MIFFGVCEYDIQSFMKESYFTKEEWKKLSLNEEFWGLLNKNKILEAGNLVNKILGKDNNFTYSAKQLLNLQNNDTFNGWHITLINKKKPKKISIRLAVWLRYLRIDPDSVREFCARQREIQIIRERIDQKEKNKLKRSSKKQKRELSHVLNRNTSANYGNKLFKPPGGKISQGVIFTPKSELEKNENSP